MLVSPENCNLVQRIFWCNSEVFPRLHNFRGEAQFSCKLVYFC